jgi:hypothetical protein
MALCGQFVISSVDNLLKPYLISQRRSLPLLPITLGAFGGIVAFGFIGVFIGRPSWRSASPWSGSGRRARPRRHDGIGTGRASASSEIRFRR